MIRAADLDLLAELARASGARPAVLVDSGSGAGKSTLAAALAPRLGAQLVSLDDVYPGWDGLAAGAAAVPRMLRADAPGWRRWDWGADRFAEWHRLDPEVPLVVEGCGALSAASRALATLGVWVDLPAAERRRRALARDPGFASHWDGWASQEAAYRRAEPPHALADVVVDAN